jgi:hypothetical protein
MTKRRRGRPPRSSPKQPVPAVTAEQQAELLRKIGDGLDPVTAVLELGIDETAVWSDPQLAAKVQSAYDIVTDKVSTKALTRAVRDGSLHVMERELERRRERAAELRRRAATSTTGHVGSDWEELFKLFDPDELFLFHSFLSGDVAQLRATLRGLVTQRACELARDPEWLGGINTVWAEAIRATMRREPKPRRVDEIEVLDQEATIPTNRAVVTYRPTTLFRGG